MTDTERRNCSEFRRLLAVIALPMLDKLCCYADAPTRRQLDTVRCELTAIWASANAKLLSADSEGAS